MHSILNYVEWGGTGGCAPSEYKGAHCYSQEYVFLNSTRVVRGEVGEETHGGFARKETTTAKEVRT